MSRKNSHTVRHLKQILFLVLLLILVIGVLQTCKVNKVSEPEITSTKEISPRPSLQNYYTLSDTLSGEALKGALHRIIRNHTVFSYKQVWEILPETDLDPSDSGRLVLLYTLRSQPVAHRDRGTKFDYESNGYTLIDSWNREHVWPKSHGFPDETDTAYTDLHHLRPGDRSVNSARNTRSFGEGDLVYLDNGGKIETANKTSKESWVWEPSEQIKGDIARMVFYMAVRYEGPGYDLELVDSIVPRQNSLPILGKLSTLLDWHRQDPVSSWEKRRNDLIFYNYQGNRNPFIDNPDWVDAIWADEVTLTEKASESLSISDR